MTKKGLCILGITGLIALQAQADITLSQKEYDALLQRIEKLEQVDAYSGATQKADTATIPHKSDTIKTPKKKKTAFAVNPNESFSKFRFGGYGEILANFYDYGPNRYSGSGAGSPKLGGLKRSDISIPRFVLAFDYKFNSSWVLGAEIEFEYGGTGSGIEVEYGEGVEYEYEFEKGGEVALEQFHITKIFTKAAQLRAGHMIVPIGITNAHHEPINFFGTSRPEGENTLIPCTWHETGLSFLGSYKGFNYEAMVISGLDPYGFSSKNWIQGGRQTKFEIPIFTNPAFAARVEYEGVKGLRIGASGYYAYSTAKNTASSSATTGFRGGVAIASGDVQYKDYGLTVRGNFLYGWVDEVKAINKLRPSSYTGYSNTPVSHTAITYFVETGYNVFHFTKIKSNLTPFVRYEYHNSMQCKNTDISAVPLDWYNVHLVTAGINYYPLPNLVLKADYTHRMVGTRSNRFNNENTLSLGVAFVGWFVNK